MFSENLSCIKQTGSDLFNPVTFGDEAPKVRGFVRLTQTQGLAVAITFDNSSCRLLELRLWLSLLRAGRGAYWKLVTFHKGGASSCALSG